MPARMIVPRGTGYMLLGHPQNVYLVYLKQRAPASFALAEEMGIIDLTSLYRIYNYITSSFFFETERLQCESCGGQSTQ